MGLGLAQRNDSLAVSHSLSFTIRHPYNYEENDCKNYPCQEQKWL